MTREREKIRMRYDKVVITRPYTDYTALILAVSAELGDRLNVVTEYDVNCVSRVIIIGERKAIKTFDSLVARGWQLIHREERGTRPRERAGIRLLNRYHKEHEALKRRLQRRGNM
jgi:hypothetical protein